MAALGDRQGGGVEVRGRGPRHFLTSGLEPLVPSPICVSQALARPWGADRRQEENRAAGLSLLCGPHPGPGAEEALESPSEARAPRADGREPLASPEHVSSPKHVSRQC